MKTWKNLYPTLCRFDHLYRATQVAARGKKRRLCVNGFLLDLEPKLLRLQRELSEQSYLPGRYRQFTIRDPKVRTISAAPFYDRVVHHAICLLLEPIFERRFICHSYACRRKKGMHLALDQAKKWAREHRYFLKMDVRKFYDSVVRSMLKDRLRRIIRDPQFLWLLDLIIDTAPTRTPGMGLPIGNLTSQHFANFLLDSLDRHVKQALRARYYLRYMDDVALFSDDKAFMLACRNSLEAYLPRELRLNWQHKATILAPTREGLPFLGFTIYPRHSRIQQKNWRRYKKNFMRLQRQVEEGEIDPETFFMAIESMTGHLSLANTFRLRHAFFAEHCLDL